LASSAPCGGRERLSEGALPKMIAEDATVAAQLLLNLSKMLCVKLICTH
jgi:hypothetical protein